MTIRTVYSIYHWWSGDKVSNPCWVKTNTKAELTSLPAVKKALIGMREMGWKEFKVFKHTIEKLDPEEICPSSERITTKTGKRSLSK